MYPCSGVLAEPDPAPVPEALGVLLGPARAGVLFCLDTPEEHDAASGADRPGWARWAATSRSCSTPGWCSGGGPDAPCSITGRQPARPCWRLSRVDANAQLAHLAAYHAGVVLLLHGVAR